MVHDNPLTSLDLTSNPNLEMLDVAHCGLTSIDVSNNQALDHFSGLENLLTSLDLSSNTALTSVAIEGNPLTYLNMKNGLTSELIRFSTATNEGTLSCIETLDPEWATANWTYENGNIDQGTNFDVICNVYEHIFLDCCSPEPFYNL